METKSPEKEQWEGKVTAELPETRPHQAWQLLSDYCNLHYLLPSLDSCFRVSGEEGFPGCVRRCEMISTRKSSGVDSISWAEEELLSLDHRSLSFTYRVLDNNMGFGRFFAQMKILPEDDYGCRIEWSFVADPLAGRRLAALVRFLDGSLKTIAWNIQSKKIRENLWEFLLSLHLRLLHGCFSCGYHYLFSLI